LSGQHLHLRLRLRCIKINRERQVFSLFYSLKQLNNTAMSLYTLTTASRLPNVPLPQGLRMEMSDNVELLSAMGSITVEEVIRRMANDHVAFAAYINDVPAAFGWMASGKAFIGELNHEIILPVGNRYLWNFRTMEAFRGLGIYPALLQYIIRHESKKANRFWIAHAPENRSSLKGIKKAGFHFAGKLYSHHGAVIERTSLSLDCRELLAEMNISISEEDPASCWNCSSPFYKKRKAECCCEAAGDECNGILHSAGFHFSDKVL
jgi:GNAT superfamily N-acetyltransferase